MSTGYCLCFGDDDMIDTGGGSIINESTGDEGTDLLDESRREENGGDTDSGMLDPRTEEENE
jgi:hypothetical protein